MGGTRACRYDCLPRYPLRLGDALLLLVLGQRALPLLAPRLDDDLLDLEGDRARHLLLERAARHLVEDRLRLVQHGLMGWG